MTWLGARHDGHRHATSLSAYVWMRLPAATSPSEHLALWQSALSFGVLEAITSMQIPESLLLSAQPDGTLALTNKKVSILVSCWLFRYPATTDHTFVSRQVKHAHAMVTWALSAIEEYTAKKRSPNGSFSDTDLGLTSQAMDDIVCSLITYSDWILNTLRALRDHMNIRQGRVPLCSAAEAAAFDAYERRIGASGWCPYTLNLFTFGLQALAYASVSSPFLRRSARKHATCTRDRCIAHNVNTATYKTQHAPSCLDSSCPFLSPSLTRVLELLSSGSIPVIVYEDNALSVRSAADGPYIAISHVWADGLGSTTEAGLPTCQISRIATYARQLVPEGAFWVDALCVPEVEEPRKRAIRLMAETYQRAEKVVVFDAGFRTFCTSQSPLKEVALRIVTSSWMQRVWTLQEALLARDLYFEFSDCLVPNKQLEDAFTQSLEPVPSSLGPVSRDLALYGFPIDNILLMSWRRSHTQHNTFSFIDIAGLLQYRTTSKPEDETIAIAGLLGIDPVKLLAERDADARMRVFLLELKTVPADIMVNYAATTKLLGHPVPDGHRAPWAQSQRWYPEHGGWRIARLKGSRRNRHSPSSCFPKSYSLAGPTHIQTESTYSTRPTGPCILLAGGLERMRASG